MKILVTFILFTLLIIFACQSSIHKSETVVRRGVAYQVSDDQPFTGIVEGRGREDYRRRILWYKKPFKDALLDGICEFWYPNGNLESEVPYDKGQINGVVRRYYENGQLKARIPVRNGLRGGSAGELFWDKSGKLIKG